MAVRATDFAILIVNVELGALVAADGPTDLLGLGLGFGDAACLLASVALDLPAAILVRHDAMGVSCHYVLLFRYWVRQPDFQAGQR